MLEQGVLINVSTFFFLTTFDVCTYDKSFESTNLSQLRRDPSKIFKVDPQSIPDAFIP